MQAGGRAERQSDMELLRILAVAGVIVLHFNAKALPVAPPIGRRFLLLLLLVFSLWNALVDLLSTVTGLSLASSSTVGIKGAQEGYTIVNFILCYCVGAAIGRKSLVLPRPGLLFLGYLAATVTVIYAVGLLAHCLYTAAASPIRKRLDERVRFPIISL